MTEEKTMQITADMIKELRAASGAGVLDCRKALEAADGRSVMAANDLHTVERRGTTSKASGCMAH